MDAWGSLASPSPTTERSIGNAAGSLALAAWIAFINAAPASANPGLSDAAEGHVRKSRRNEVDDVRFGRWLHSHELELMEVVCFGTAFWNVISRTTAWLSPITRAFICERHDPLTIGPQSTATIDRGIVISPVVETATSTTARH